MLQLQASRALLQGLIFLLLLFIQPAHGDVTDPTDHRHHLQSVEQHSRSAFDEVIAWYEAYTDEQPFDVVAAVEHCRFISAFVSTFEYLEWIDDIANASAECGESLRETYRDHPEVELYHLESHGDGVIKHGESLLRSMKPEAWTEGQLSRLLSRLAAAHSGSNHAAAGQYALQALDVDLTANVYLIAARHLIASGQTARARALLTSPADPHDPRDSWYASEKMRLLTEIGAHDDARAVHERLRSSGAHYDHVAAANLLRELSLIDAARAELEITAPYAWNAKRIAQERFRLEFAEGTAQQALGAYNQLRDHGYSSDPFAVNRVALLARDITLPWRARDLLGIGAALGLLLVLAALAVIPVSFVHYRGLVRRARSGEPHLPPGGWHLRHAWMALAAYAVATTGIFYVAGPFDMGLQSPAGWDLALSPAQWARVAIAGEIAALALMVVVAWRAGRPLMPWAQQWSVTRAVLIGVAVALLARVPVIAAVLIDDNLLRTELAQDQMISIIRHIHATYGMAAAIWLACVAAPVLEEFMFRGVLLQAFAKHISFGWANAYQALLFALVHFNLGGAAYLFVVAFVFGSITRRSGGLLASIVAHSILNLVLLVVTLR